MDEMGVWVWMAYQGDQLKKMYSAMQVLTSVVSSSICLPYVNENIWKGFTGLHVNYTNIEKL